MSQWQLVKGGENVRVAETIETIEEQAQRENAEVSDWLLYYEDRLHSYKRDCKDILSEGLVGPVTALNKGRKVSDPTGRKAVALTRLGFTAEWLQLIDDVTRRLPWQLQIFLRLRRDYRDRRGQHGWVAPVQHKYAEKAAKHTGKDPEDVWIESRTTFYRWWKRIVEYTAREAGKRGLLS